MFFIFSLCSKIIIKKDENQIKYAHLWYFSWIESIITCLFAQRVESPNHLLEQNFPFFSLIFFFFISFSPFTRCHFIPCFFFVNALFISYCACMYVWIILNAYINFYCYHYYENILCTGTEHAPNENVTRNGKDMNENKIDEAHEQKKNRSETKLKGRNNGNGTRIQKNMFKKGLIWDSNGNALNEEKKTSNR